MTDNQTIQEVLLIKPKKHNTYIKKGNGYLHRFLGVVNKNNQIIGVGLDPQQHIIQTQNLTNSDKTIIGKTRLQKAKPEDQWVILRYNTLCRFNSHEYNTEKQVRGVRYATQNETSFIKEMIVRKMAHPLNLTRQDVLWNSQKYAGLYSKCCKYNLLSELFELDKHGLILEGAFL